MANLAFDQLQDVLPVEEIVPVNIRYKRDVDTRSVIFEDGLTLTFSYYMSDTFSKFFSRYEKDSIGPAWISDAWVTTMTIVKHYKLGSVVEDNVAYFLLGRLDTLAFYQEFSL